MKWKCTKCQTENKDTYICLKCGFDESKNYARYATIAVLQEKDKSDFRKMIFKGDNVLMACPDMETELLQYNFGKDIYIDMTSSKGDNILMACLDPDLVFGKNMSKSKIKSIQIYNTLSEVNKTAWDVSAHKDGSVLAWVIEDKAGWKHLKLAADGDIIANKNCSELFQFYSNLECINGFQYLNTKNVINMESMFMCCSSLLKLDLSGFDTGNVVAMSNMFFGCSSLQELKLRSFDTKNVVDMGAMFAYCSNLQKLDLSSFDTRKVKSMREMFGVCSNLRELDLSSFDTRNVMDMEGMFYECNNLQEFQDLNNFDIENVKYPKKLKYKSKIDKKKLFEILKEQKKVYLLDELYASIRSK